MLIQNISRTIVTRTQKADSEGQNFFGLLKMLVFYVTSTDLEYVGWVGHAAGDDASHNATDHVLPESFLCEHS